MRGRTRWCLALGLAAFLGAGHGARAESPHIGYIYPAGGQRGAKLRVKVGGQYLRGAFSVYVSGTGVRATPAKYIRSLSSGALNDLQNKLSEVSGFRRRRATALEEGDMKEVGRLGLFIAKANEEFEILALRIGLDDPSPAGYAKLRAMLSDPRRQPNAQLDETVGLEVRIAPDAEPGLRELRLRTSSGFSNPLNFHVGQFREYCEQEPNDRTPDSAVLTATIGKKAPAKPEPLMGLPDGKLPENEAEGFSFDLPNLETLPVIINGQILPGDVDRFRFEVEKGTRLVAAVQARALVPYLADAVPGWFQATLTLLDPKGNEVAFADDFRFHPDPVIYYEIPEDGQYALEIKDSIYRGREDFVYRITVGQVPFITDVFPLGARAGTTTAATIAGWNLPTKRLALDTRPGHFPIRHAALRYAGPQSNDIVYAVDSLPEAPEAEPNDAPATAQRVDLPHILNGRIERPGDVDVFQFTARANDQIVAEVQARRLQSPLDSMLRLTDADGHMIAWNDDYVIKEGHLHRDLGIITHHADSYLTATLPKDGVYYVHLVDTQKHGGDAYAYRLRISPPRPDVTLHVTPSSLTVAAGGHAPITVDALRKDGFEGDIQIELKDAPKGFALTAARIPSGCNRLRMTLDVPLKAPSRTFSLRLQGRLEIEGKAVTRPVIPSDDVMQAFLWRHLVSTNQWMVTVAGRRSGPVLKPIGESPLALRGGSTAHLCIAIPEGDIRKQLRFTLDEPPKGLAIKRTTPHPEGLAIEITADAKKVQHGLKGNLILNVARERPITRQDGTTTTYRSDLGPMAAIPFEIAPAPPEPKAAQKPPGK